MAHFLFFIFYLLILLLLILVVVFFLLLYFSAFDTDRNGLIGCSELYSGLEWLGLHLVPSQVQDVVREMDKTGKGFVSFDEFRNALGIHKGEEEKEAAALLDRQHTDVLRQQRGNSEDDAFGFGLSAIDGTSGRQAPSDSVVMFERIEIETKQIQEIAQLNGDPGTSGTPGTKNIVKVLKDVKFYTRKMTSFTRVWNTKKTKARCDGECFFF